MKKSKVQALEAQVRLLQKQLNASLQLLSHQDKHLVFLESLIGKSCQQESSKCDNTELHNHIRKPLEGTHE